MNQFIIKSSEGAYAVNSFSENLIVFFENPHSNFQSRVVSFEDCVVGFEGCIFVFELCDDTILSVDFAI
jgi:hypothetical protein